MTIHGRTRSDDYSKPVNLDGIRLGVRCAHSAQENSQPLVAFGNGNIFTAADAQKMLAETGCDGVMVSRGVMGNPWVFREINAGESSPVSLEEWLSVVLKHIDYQEETYGNTEQAAILLRKHLLGYAKGFSGTKHLRGEICQYKSLQDLRALFRDFSKTHPPHLVRMHVANELSAQN